MSYQRIDLQGLDLAFFEIPKSYKPEQAVYYYQPFNRMSRLHTIENIYYIKQDFVWRVKNQFQSGM